MERIREFLLNCFRIKNLREYFLDIKLYCSIKRIVKSQREYVLDIL